MDTAATTDTASYRTPHSASSPAVRAASRASCAAGPTASAATAPRRVEPLQFKPTTITGSSAAVKVPQPSTPSSTIGRAVTAARVAAAAPTATVRAGRPGEALGHHVLVVSSRNGASVVQDESRGVRVRPVHQDLDLLPFRRAVAAGVSGVMCAHVLVPAWDALPASLSRVATTTTLRQQWGFSGLTFTDDLEMGAVAKHWPVAEAATLAVAAGHEACVE